jgi:tRNA threonylcarbamoyladenosine biosynthesis protein TsaE
MKVLSDSPAQTIALGKKVAKLLSPGDVIALIGDLGTGKTTFTKGLAKGLAVEDPQHLNSPSFVLIKEYKGRFPFYHFDFYRINSLFAKDISWYEEYLFGSGVSVIEWAEKIKSFLPQDYLEVNFSFKDATKREIRIKGRGARYKKLIKRL